MKGILGKKLGMTQIYTADGKSYPVTVVEAGPCCVVQVKTLDKDGYDAVKIGFLQIDKKKLNKPSSGVFKKAATKPYKILREFDMSGLQVGEFITVEQFVNGEKVSVSGVSKGKGFQGVIKRHNFSGGPGSHGSMFNRAPGSIGASSYPSRVWKNQKLPSLWKKESLIDFNKIIRHHILSSEIRLHTETIYSDDIMLKKENVLQCSFQKD